MASLYADENFPLQAVETLRRLGHDVLTALDAGQANRAIADDEVLEFAAQWVPSEAFRAICRRL